MSGFPELRLHRLRRTETLRNMFRETDLNTGDLICPVFVTEGRGKKEAVASMPGVFRYSPDLLAEEAKEIAGLGLPAVILFGIPAHKDELGSGAYQSDGIIPQAIEAISKVAPDLLVVTDVCLCEYTSHGHCGVVVDDFVDNDRTLELLAKTAVAHARTGAGMVAPSDMMDGRVGAIRQALDREGFNLVPIMSYAAKYASAFYESFREAADCAPKFGDRRSYQMNPANWREALREMAQDIAEGADVVMVKPALPYLDVLRKVRDTFNCPLAAYNVSGEFVMVKAAAQQGWLDEKRAVLEILTAIKRAGADVIITYHARDAARWLSRA